MIACCGARAHAAMYPSDTSFALRAGPNAWPPTDASRRAQCCHALLSDDEALRTRQPKSLLLVTVAFSGTLYDAAEALLEAAAKRLPAAAWAADAGLRTRARAWRRRARRAALVARQLAPASDVAAQEEALALLDLGSLQGLPPAFDQRCRVRPRHAVTSGIQ
jgi:hypothetical protein